MPYSKKLILEMEPTDEWHPLQRETELELNETDISDCFDQDGDFIDEIGDELD